MSSEEKKSSSNKMEASPPDDYDGLHKITETVYLSDVFAIIDPNNRKVLQRLKIKHVLTASYRPVKEDVPPGVRYKFIHVFDMRQANLLGSGVLHEALKYIDAADAKQEPILVHCEAGVSRSVTLVCAHLMKKNNWTAEQTIDYVKERRPQADPNDSFRMQLKIFEKAGYNADPSTIRKSPAYAEFLPQLKHYGIEPHHHHSKGNDGEKSSAKTATAGSKPSSSPPQRSASNGAICSIL